MFCTIEMFSKIWVTSWKIILFNTIRQKFQQETQTERSRTCYLKAMISTRQFFCFLKHETIYFVYIWQTEQLTRQNFNLGLTSVKTISLLNYCILHPHQQLLVSLAEQIYALILRELCLTFESFKDLTYMKKECL